MGSHELDHIGIVVADLTATVAFFEEHFGTRPGREVSVPDMGIESVFLTGLGPVDLELVQHGNPELRAARLGDRRARLDHIALAVPDVDTELARLEPQGLCVQTGAPRLLGGRTTAFLQAGDALDLFLQLVGPLPLDAGV
jgi:catechol 2,3-dioxygenase-like lactoylglutathione lyase family enzyme